MKKRPAEVAELEHLTGRMKPGARAFVLKLAQQGRMAFALEVARGVDGLRPAMADDAEEAAEPAPEPRVLH